MRDVKKYILMLRRNRMVMAVSSIILRVLELFLSHTLQNKENNHRKINIFGSLISAVSISQAVSLVEEKIKEKNSSYICVCPVSSIVTATEDREFQNVINNAFLATPDGMPVV